MSDNGLTTDAVPAAVTQQTPPPAAPASAPDGAADPLADPPADRAVFDRGYVESVRGEAKRYREEARTTAEQLRGYNEVFGVYEPADQAVWMDLARTWATNPERAAQVMQQIASGVLGAQQPTPAAEPETPAPVAGFDDDLLTQDRVKEIVNETFAQREARAAEARAIDEVFGEVRAAGYDPETAEGFMVLYNANHHTGGDIAKAVELTRAYEQKVIDNYVQGRRSGAVPTPTGGVVATPAAEPIKNIEDARRATDNFLRERRVAQ